MTREDILHLGNLSRIRISDEEVGRFQGEIEAILEYVSAVNKIASTTLPKKQVGLVKNITREDVVINAPLYEREAIVAAFPDRTGDYLKVKRILNPDS